MEVRRKCDPELGRKVNEHLLSLGLETPMSRVRDEFNSEEAIEYARVLSIHKSKSLIKEIMDSFNYKK